MNRVTTLPLALVLTVALAVGAGLWWFYRGDAPAPVDFDAATGEAIAATATGTLTIHGVSRPVIFGLEAQLVGDTVVVVGTTKIAFSDSDVAVPSSPIVLSVDDTGTLERQLLLTAP